MHRIRERELYRPVVEFLSGQPDGSATMAELRNFVADRFSPKGEDTAILQNRNDKKYEQKVRNIRSHRTSPKNPIGLGYVEPVSGGLRLTKAGRRIAEARMKGYEGDPCPECSSFTLVRNGTCLKCDNCGGTTGCS